MNFKDGQAIYIQIAVRLSDEILNGTYPPDGRVPGVREYSSMLEVNVNTAVKAFDYLSQQGVLYNRRGLGYFVSPEAHSIIEKARKTEFIRDFLPELFKRMKQLGIGIGEIEEEYNKLPASDR